jgi:hypothetical protein
MQSSRNMVEFKRGAARRAARLANVIPCSENATKSTNEHFVSITTDIAKVLSSDVRAQIAEPIATQCDLKRGAAKNAASYTRGHAHENSA